MIIDKDEPKDSEDYHFSEEDLMGSDISSPVSTSEPKYEEPTEKIVAPSVTQRNALIVLGGLISLFILYRLMMWVSSPSENIPKTNKLSEVKLIKVQPKPVDVITAAPIPAPTAVQVTPSETERQLSSLISDHSKMQSDLQGVETTVSGLQTNTQTLITKIDDLNKLVTDLNAKIENQAAMIKLLEVKRNSPPKLRRSHHGTRGVSHHEPLYLQAIIPGRAWLIKRNGADTMTVREGTRIPGYGIVQIIDPNQGRVVLSSGLVITFGQWDS